VLARVFEAAGLATVGLSLVRRQAENVKAPRFLHCQFPLGRPLGRPGDPAFQTDVLRRAFVLLERTDVPLVEDHPEVIDDQTEEPAACSVPPRHDPSLHPAVDEARGLRNAYHRQVTAAGGRTAVGRVATADTIDAMVERFTRLAAGASLDEVGLSGRRAIAGGQDIRAYYEEAALALVGPVPAARQVESWFYTGTEAGAVVRAAAKALQGAGVDRNIWYYLLPGSQQ
jgi:D-proline reductase (dithiol) PrdB